MPVFTKKQDAILFVHIPKCAGSSFERAMKANGWKEYFSIRGIALPDLEWSKVSPQHFHAELLESCLEPEKFSAIVTIVRNPFKRLVSEYFWQLKQKVTNLDPDSWLDSVYSQYEKNQLVYDNHIRPQTEFILPGTEVFKLEEDGVANAIAFIEKRYPGNAFSLQRLKDKLLFNKQEKKSDYNESLVQEFESRKTEIKKFYKVDYDRFGYE